MLKLLLILLTLNAYAGRLQNEDHKTEAELIGAGGTKAQLLNDTKIYVTSIAKTLDDAILDGDIAGDVLTTKGSILGHTGVAQSEFTACADDEILIWDTAESLGFKCDVIPDMSLPLMAKGSLVTSNGTANGEFTACADGEFLEWDVAELSGVKCTPIPPALSADVYSSTEVTWGLWNGVQLYRRCITILSDITTSTLIASWATGLKPVNTIKYTDDLFVLVYVGFDASLFARVNYNTTNGQVTSAVGGSYKVAADTSFCVEYIK